MDLTLPCPHCKTLIPLQVDRLLEGAKFSCPGCSARIGLEEKSLQALLDAHATSAELKQRPGESDGADPSP